MMKPKTKEEAFNNLKEFYGNSDEEINCYINNESNTFKYCEYVSLGKASIFIDKIDGDYNTLLGLSPSILFEKLKELGYSINDLEFEKEDD